ncbi:MAG: putative sugar nucleotidyl transferase [Candidatus Margulisiibacteriota bacterium]|jgi:UDP-N-acetylglucosamine diphosphorylase/glucosamine-1-phosphate N-acetyltransferase
MLNLTIFEDKEVSYLFPLTLNHPAFELLNGALSILSRINLYFPNNKINFLIREELKLLTKEKYPLHTVNNLRLSEDQLLINSRCIIDQELYDKIISSDFSGNWIYLNEKDELLAAYLKDKQLNTAIELLKNQVTNQDLLNSIRIDCLVKDNLKTKLISNLWDLVYFNESTLINDYHLLNQKGIIKGCVKPFVNIDNESQVFIDKNSRIENFVDINTENGPVYIEENVQVDPFTFLKGPIFIGKNSHILGGKIVNTSIGQDCKIHGELNTTIFCSHSNKAHDGFIGHSYIGEWVNLGAMTTNSNLKNTYGHITLEQDSQKLTSQKIFLGAFIGDQVKTAIGTLIATGSIIGFGSCLLGAAPHGKFVPSFSWGEKGKYQKYELEKLIATQQRMMQRRGLKLNEQEIALIKELYKESVAK